MNKDMKKRIVEAYNDIEYAYWYLVCTDETRLPRHKDDWYSDGSYMEDKIDGENPTQSQWQNLCQAKEDYKNFYRELALESKYKLTDALDRFYNIMEDLGVADEHLDDAKAYEECSKEVSNRFNRYLKRWWPSKAEEEE
tara:strand:+ start:3309 stop:3725 length:417 start_codon:yes stop_codon:yes gene_type:complete